MLTYLLELLGIQSEGSLSYYNFYLRSQWPPVIALLLMIFVVAGAIYLYQREHGLSRRTRVGLTVLRAVPLIIIIVMLFEPVMGIEFTRQVKQTVLVLVDTSESMSREDKRRSTIDINDAALAMGKTDQPAPGVSRRLASLQKETETLLNSPDQPEAKKLVEPLTKMTGDLQEMATQNSEKAKMEPVVKSIKDLRQQILPMLKRVRRSQKNESAPPDSAALTSSLTEYRNKLEDIQNQLASLPLNVPDTVAEKVHNVQRIKLARALIDSPPPALETLSEDYRVRYFAFGEKLVPSTGEGEVSARALQNLKAEAPATHLGSALQRSANLHAGQTLAGIVVLTDGAANGGTDPRAAARSLGARDIPVFPVGIGVSQPDDLAITRVIVQDVLFKDDDVTLRARIQCHGYGGRAVDLVVTLAGEEVKRKTINLKDGAQFAEVTFLAEAPAGLQDLKVQLDNLQGEAEEANNSSSRQIRVLDEKIRVLYVESKPRWEYRYLRGVLLRDRRLDVKFLMTKGDPELARASDEHLQRFPLDPSEAFSYDLVIIGDVPASHFEPIQIQRLEELVRERGGSFLMLAGHRHAPATYKNTELAPLLPIKIGNGWEKVPKNVHLVPTAEGFENMLARLDHPASANKEIWSLVRPLRNVPRVEGTKSGAIVIATLSDADRRATPYPAIVWQRYGTGKSMFVATDRLWRMRYKRGDTYHGRFWGQAIQFLTLSRLLGENQRIRLEVDDSQVRVGQKVHVFANVLNAAYEPVERDEYIVNLSHSDKKVPRRRLNLRSVPGTPGLYEGMFLASDEGTYDISVPAADRDLANSVQVRAKPGNLENLEPAMQAGLLKEIAAQSGGRFLTARTVSSLPGYLDSETRTTVVHKEKELWDWWPILALLACCVSVEWFVRRRKNLV